MSPRPASAAWVLRARRLARRSRLGSGRLRAAPRLARPARPYFYPPPSTPARPVVTLAVAQRWLQACSATLRVTRPAAAIGAGGPAGAGSRRCRPWAARLPRIPPAGRRATAEASCCPNPGPRRVPTRGFPVRRHCARHKRRATVRRRSPNRRAAEAVAGRVEALGTSVLSPRTPPLPSGTSPKDEMPCTCHCLPLLPCPGRRDGVGAEPTEKPGRKMHLVETPYHQCGTSPPGRNTTWCEWCDGHLLGNEGEG